MADIILLIGKVLFLGLLYLFLLAAVRTGIGLVDSTRPAKSEKLRVRITRGPGELVGTRLPLTRTITVGRSPEADVVIADGFVSTMHARLSPSREGAIVEDLGSTNGTLLNGQRLTTPATAREGDVVTIGQVELALERA